MRTKTAEKVREIEAKIHDLQRIREKLLELSTACEHHGSPEACLVVHALEDPADLPQPTA